MELTKEQIKHIDDRLENEGIKYWDIRIEMLDHVVSDVEKRLSVAHSNYQFEELVQESFENLGWKENFNGGGFEKVFLSRSTLYSKKQNKNFKQYFKETILKANFVLGFLTYATGVLLFQENKLALKVIIFSTIIFHVIFMLRFAFKYKVMNSARMNSILLFATLPISIFNLVIYIPQVFFNYKIDMFLLSWVMVALAPLSAIGISYLNIEFKKTKNVYNKLIS